jgi:hypothetical protein
LAQTQHYPDAVVDVVKEDTDRDGANRVQLHVKEDNSADNMDALHNDLHRDNDGEES